MKSKRNLSDSDLKSQSESDCYDSELEANSSLESEEQIVGSSKAGSNLPTDKDFQFKEPQFIFHPFKHISGVFTPESSPPRPLWWWPSPSSSVGCQLRPLPGAQLRRVDLVPPPGAWCLDSSPWLLLAKFGCSVTLSDSSHCVKNCKEVVRLNRLEDGVQVVPLSWGLVTSKLL